ncbi:helix-turn-helix domain-containing protein [Gammaproteobacteria bacterium]|nr:helix-turn-helix domain-containing protein [Gammaproteobacteria bacterium]
MSDNLKSANSAKTGIIFSDARLDQKLTIDEVSDKTLINTKFIKAIESGDYTDFPSEGFAKAYFIKYQNFLNIQCEFPSIYVQENRKDQIVKKSVAVFNRSFKKFIIVFGLALLILTISILLNSFSVKDSTQKIEQNIKEEELYELTEIVKANNMSEDIEASTNLTIEPVLPTNNLQLLFTKECWVEIYSKDILLVSQLFNEGDIYNKIMQKPYKVVVGNVDAVTGTYNGIKIDFITNANRLNVNTIIFNDE